MYFILFLLSFSVKKSGHDVKLNWQSTIFISKVSRRIRYVQIEFVWFIFAQILSFFARNSAFFSFWEGDYPPAPPAGALMSPPPFPWSLKQQPPWDFKLAIHHSKATISNFQKPRIQTKHPVLQQTHPKIMVRQFLVKLSLIQNFDVSKIASKSKKGRNLLVL